jgi:hypothetical protein
MTNKQKLIFDYLVNHNGQAYYIDIRDSMSMQFDSEDDFDNTLSQLIHLNLVYENEEGDTLYKVRLSQKIN